MIIMDRMTPNNNRNRNVLSRFFCRAAFTLIELLVVIAIIAILAAMLLPALGNAKKRAQMVGCISNNKQIALSFILWSSEHNNGKFPWNKGPEQFPLDPPRDIWGALQDYIKTPTLIKCPSDIKRTNILSWAVFGPAYQFRNGCSYFFGVDAQPDRPTVILTGDNYISSDAPKNQTLVMPNTSSGSGNTFNRSLVIRHGWWANSGRHNKNAGVTSFVDGSARTLKVPDFQQVLADTFDRYLPNTTNTMEFVLPQYVDGNMYY